MKLKHVLFLICLLLIGMLLALAAAAGYNGYTYTVSNGKVTITSYPYEASGSVVISDTIDGYPVTSIGDRAFEGCHFTSIELPSTVTSIGNYAFAACMNVTSILIPPSVTHIGSYAFTGCPALTSIEIPSKVAIIWEGTFDGCSSLTGIEIPSKVTSIGAKAFYNCSSLTSIVIPSKVTSIGEQAFSGCTGLTSITIPSSVTSIGSGGLSCSATILNTVDGVRYIPTTDNPYFYCVAAANTVTSANIHSGCKFIAARAFQHNYNLTSITVPASVISIGELGCYMPSSSSKSITIWNATCAIFDAAGTLAPSSTIYGRSGSTAQAYVDKHGGTLTFVVATCAHPSFDDWTVETPVTCTADGYRTHICLTCGDTVGEIISAIGHTEVELPAVPVACTSDGLTAGVKCSVCNEILTAQEVIPAPGHSEVELPAVPATCTGSGLTAGVKCSVCNTILTAQVVVPALEHDYQITQTYLEATCTEVGVAKYTCTRCGDTKYDDIPKVNPLSLSGAYTDGSGKLRFVTRVTTTAGDPEIEYFGTYIVALTYFTENELTAGGEEQLGVGRVKYMQNIASGSSFAADLTSIPPAAYDAPIFAWSFVKFSGIETVFVETLGVFTVNGATLVKGGF